MKPKCLECHTPLLGRSDKKFCDNLCRTAHHNKIQHRENIEIRKTISILTKNRSILKQIFESGETIVSLKYIEIKGFRKEYFTQFHMVNDKMGAKHCFDYSYIEIEEGVIQIAQLVAKTEQV